MFSFVQERKDYLYTARKAESSDSIFQESKDES